MQLGYLEALERLIEDLTCDMDEDEEPEIHDVSWLVEGRFEVPGCFHTNRVNVVRSDPVAVSLVSWFEESESAVCSGNENCYRCVIEGNRYTVAWLRCGSALLISLYRMVREGDEWVRKMIIITA